MLFFQLSAQNTTELQKEIASLKNQDENLRHRFVQIEKMVDDVTWYHKLGNISHIDKLYIYGPPKWKEKKPTAKGAGNPVKFWTYVFISLNIDLSKKYPLIDLPHSGVHSDFTTYYTHIVRELVTQEYKWLLQNTGVAKDMARAITKKLIMVVWKLKIPTQVGII